MKFETESELKAKSKRIEELEKLIADATHLVDLAKDVDDPARLDARRRERGLLMQELEWYRRGHSFADWPKFKEEMIERQRANAEQFTAQSRLEAVRQAEIDKKAAEREAELRKKFEEETDPYIAWKRSRTARTF